MSHSLPFGACALLLTACIGKAEPKGPTEVELCGSDVPHEVVASLSPTPGNASPSALSAGGSTRTGISSLSSKVGHGLLAIDVNQRPFKPTIPGRCVTRGTSYALRLWVCVSEEGAVSDVTITRPSRAILNERVPEAVRLWKYRPYLVDGVAKPFCYPLVYRVQ